jgi:hypothetical protein
MDMIWVCAKVFVFRTDFGLESSIYGKCCGSRSKDRNIERLCDTLVLGKGWLRRRATINILLLYFGTWTVALNLGYALKCAERRENAIRMLSFGAL